MPKIKRVPELQTKEFPYVAEYECICGRKKEYHGNKKPEWFGDLLCFDCIGKNMTGE